MRSKLLPVFLFAALTVLFSCRHNPVIPAQQVSFQSDVLPIFSGNCSQPGCHGVGSEAHSLVTYDDVMQDNYVVAGKPFQSRVYITITAQSHGTVMPPPPQSPLTSQQIQEIYVWILQGAQNN